MVCAECEGDFMQLDKANLIIVARCERFAQDLACVAKVYSGDQNLLCFQISFSTPLCFDHFLICLPYVLHDFFQVVTYSYFSINSLDRKLLAWGSSEESPAPNASYDKFALNFQKRWHRSRHDRYGME